MSKNDCLRKLDELDVYRNQMYHSVSDFSVEQLLYQVEGKWSVLQILEHLKQSENLSLKYLNYKIDQKTDFKKADWKSKRDSLLFSFFQWYPKKRKAPDKPGLSPDNDSLELDTIRDDWSDVRDGFRKLINDQNEDFFDLAVYRLPHLGYVSAYQMLDFFHAHMKRHNRQLQSRKSKIAKLTFPQ